jgi:protein-L-isoaspartate(D-aspartate) O-methyltransferase
MSRKAHKQQLLAQRQPQRQRLLAQLQARGVTDSAVLRAMENVPREAFISAALQSSAYEDRVLPIGEQQTISMPSVVGVMTQALQLSHGAKVLEIGTGSGYQAAVLAELARRVFSIERFDSLSATAQQVLESLGYTNLIYKVGDGTLGWQEQAPFDRIITTAAAPTVPRALLDQLAPEGILVAPVGAVKQSDVQILMRYHKQADGSVQSEKLGKVQFVPLVGQQGVAA